MAPNSNITLCAIGPTDDIGVPAYEAVVVEEPTSTSNLGEGEAMAVDHPSLPEWKEYMMYIMKIRCNSPYTRIRKGTV